MKNVFLVVFLCCLFVTAQAQYFQTGQDPAYLKWRQINTENFQLIYPDYFENNAQKLAAKLEKVYRYGSLTLDHKPSKISVILHTQTVKSNGLVAYAPKRSEFYTTPHQSIYPQDWLEQLAIHEFRHVVQIDKINAELPEIIRFLLGEQGTALVFGAYLPWWFTEGDAVVTETALSNYGRGRLPSFLMEHRAQVVEKGIFSYDKAYNGSYKDFVPNHYKLGYYLVSATRDKFGSVVWESVIDRIGKKPFSLNAFNKQLKQETNLGKVDLYEFLFEDFKGKWCAEDSLFVSAEIKNVSPPKKNFTHYRYNHFLSDTTFLSYRTAFDKMPAFVEISAKGNEKVLHRPGDVFDESVNYRSNWIVWSEQLPDLRWSHSGRSVIRLFNINNKKRLTVNTEFKALAPSVSPQLKYVAVVETDFSYNFYLSVYDIRNGTLVHRIQTPENNYLFSPDWLNDNEIVLIMLTDSGKRLAKINLENKQSEVLLSNDLGEIKQLKVTGNQVFFISGYSGKDELFRMNIDKGTVERIAEARFGFAYPAVDDNTENVLLSNYTADGYRLVKLKLAEQSPQPLNTLEKKTQILAEKMASQEKGVIQFDDVENVQYESKKYRKISNLFGFHSWAPAAVDPGLYEIRPGFSLMSQNKLGTAETMLGYRWYLSEDEGQFFANYSFKGWYPVFNAEIASGKRASYYNLITQTKNREGEVVSSDTTLERFSWNQTNARLSIHLPLNFSSGIFTRLFQPEIKYNLTGYTNTPGELENFPTGAYHSLSYHFYYHQLLKRTFRDVYPDFGVVLDANYIHSPWGGLGNMTVGQGIVYLPGVLKNHGMRIYGGAQKKNVNGNTGFTDVVKYPRGWGRINTTSMYSASFDYKFTLLYPEFSIGGIAYLKRIQTSLFADYAYLEGNFHQHNSNEFFSTHINSYGMELTGDFHFLRFYAPANIGVRAAWLPEADRFSFDFLFSIDFNAL